MKYKNMDTNMFIRLLKDIHGDKYDYSKVKYTRLADKICIICPKHGEFWLIAANHRKGQQCPNCRKEEKLMTTEKFIAKAKKIHNEKYNYDNTIYINCDTKVVINCPIHGDFTLLPYDHLSGKGCRKCSYDLRGKNHRLTLEEFEKRAREKWGNTFTYGKYVGMHEYIDVICPKHGLFKVTPHNHLVDCGCPICSESSGEHFIRNYLELNNLHFKSQYRLNLKNPINNISLFILDFVVKFNNKYYIIEYNGILHYEYTPHFHKGGMLEFNRQLIRDKTLRTYCNRKGYILIEVKYNLSNSDIINLLNNYFLDEI